MTTIHFYIVPSIPLSEVITYINKYSNNVMTRQLLLTIGKEDKNNPGNKTAARMVYIRLATRHRHPCPRIDH